MKPSVKLLLALSLAANLVCLGLVVRHRPAPTETASLSPAGLSKAKSSSTAAGTPGPEAWKILSEGDAPADWMQRLSAAGFPKNIITAIVTAKIRERYAARRAALQSDDQEFWKKGWNYWGGGDAKTHAAMRDLWHQERQEIQNALGDAYADNPDVQRYIRGQFGNVPKEKIGELQHVIEDYQDMSSEIYQKANGVMLPEDQEKIAFLEKAKRDDLAALLTPEQLQDYEMRSSQTANSLRWQLNAFNPTEQEFRSLFTLQREFDLQFPSRQSGEEDPKRSEARTALQNQIKATLGEERYAEYQRAQDGNFQQLANLTDRLELPKATAVSVYDLSKDIQQRAQKIRSDNTLKGDAKNQALAALADEANTKVTAALGERGFEAYKAYGGWWLRNIAPPRPAK